MNLYHIFTTCLLLHRSSAVFIEGQEPAVIAHGGAGLVPEDEHIEKMKGIKIAASIAYETLKKGGSSLDAVEACVNYMEDNENFNAGHGSVLNLDGKVAMDASIQRGSDLSSGAVTLIKEFGNPISIARRVLEDSPHCFLGGEGAKRFAIKQGFKLIDPNSLITEAARKALEDFIKNGGWHSSKNNMAISQGKHQGGVGTVGCVAVDSHGKVAAATSTGGLTGKYVGRIGDSPQVGSGTYADDFVGGVSSTGHGETVNKFVLAHTIIKLMESGESAQNATTKAVTAMTNRLKGTAGAITISNKGDIGLHFSTEHMPWSHIKAGKIHYGIFPNQDDSEDYE